MDLSSYIAVEQKQVLSASQVQALHILALTNQELEAFMVNEYLENPMLEIGEPKENEILTSIERLSGAEAGIACADQHPGNPDGDDGGRRELSAGKGNLLKENLLGQLNWNSYSRRQWKIMDYLVDCLDEKGFFAHDLGELSGSSGYGEEELGQCLAVLRELEPAGIFSPNLAECLVRQLEKKGIEDETLFCILREHLGELTGGRIGTISRSLGISAARVKEYIRLIGSLNPRPVMDGEQSEAACIVPDILVTRPGGRWNVELNDQWTGEYKYSGYYIRMMEESTDPELCAYFKERMERARFVINSVEQRRKTIVRVVEAVVKRQEDYFELKGPLVPMGLEDIGTDLGLHASTVSRAVKGKYVQYKKTEPLKALFTAAAAKSGEQDGISPEHIKEKLRSLIASEGQKPLSDQKLTEMLAAEGIAISRRAVAKYRIQMNIPDSRQRALL